MIGLRTAGAQPPVRRSWSPSPTLSPWLDLFRYDSGLLDPYNALVRPRLELQERLRRQQLDIARQAAGLSAMRQQLSHSSAQMPIRPTGAASVYMDYSHYYPALQGTRGAGPARRAPRQGWTPPRTRSYHGYGY